MAAASVAEELRKESELQALEAGLEAKFEAIRSRSNSAHVVPSHCGEFQYFFCPNLSFFVAHLDEI